MITMRDFMETINYRITEGSDYCCPAFGGRQYSLSAWNGDHDGWSLNIVFDTEDQTVYMMETCDYKNQRAYRLINPDFKNQFMKDQDSHRDQAWDDVYYIDLETDEDMIEKSQAIVDGMEYDTRIQVPIELEDDVLFSLLKMAHERDMTFNELVSEIIKEQITQLEQDQNIKNLIKTDIL